jgi:hypothetical protein
VGPHGVTAKNRVRVCVLLAALIGVGGCVKVGVIRADRDWYTLKEATNGRNMVLASWRLCQSDPSCSPTERTELEKARDRAEADYQKALAEVNYDHSHGWYADVNSMPAFARDPSLGLTP